MNASIIVPYFNASSTIGWCVEAIKKQMDADDELIVVNDGSSVYHSKELNQLSECKIFSHTKNKGAAQARNLGMKKASHDVYVFVDADVLLEEGCLLALKKKLSRGADACFVVPSNARHESFFTDYKNLYMIDILSRQDKDLNYIYGSCCALGDNVKKLTWPTELKLIEDNILGYELWRTGAVIQKVTDVSFIHMKMYTALSLMKNDFLVSFQFARLMIQKSRWSTLYSESKFGHTEKKQKVSVIMSVLFLVTSLFSFTLSSVVLSSWFLLNWRLFKYLNQERGTLFFVRSIFWTYISHLVYFSGILSGFSWEFLSKLCFKGKEIEQN